MRTFKASRFRVYPTPAQEAKLRSYQGPLRFLWNLAHEQRLMGLARPKCDRVYVTAFDQIKQLTELRALLPWLAQVSRSVCEQVLVDLDRAWQRAFKKLGRVPHWKRKGRDELGMREANPKKWRLDSEIHFPKIGPMKVVQHRPLEGRPGACTIKADGDQFFASIACEIEGADPTPHVGPHVGIDRGIVNVTADSDGKIVPNPRFYERSMERLARAQRAVSSKKKGSNNREKAKARVMRLHRKIRRQRDHVLHVLSAGYAKSHAVVGVEDLRIENMVRVGGGLSRSIGAAGWGRFVELLTYKCARNGGTVVKVPAAYSSQECAVCGHVAAENRKVQAEFSCVACGVCVHADVNAAKVILQRTNRSLMPGEGTALEATRRTRKRVALRVPRRPLESSAL